MFRFNKPPISTNKVDARYSPSRRRLLRFTALAGLGLAGASLTACDSITRKITGASIDGKGVEPYREETIKNLQIGETVIGNIGGEEYKFVVIGTYVDANGFNIVQVALPESPGTEYTKLNLDQVRRPQSN